MNSPIGQTFGRWVVVGFNSDNKMCDCVCYCSAKKQVRVDHLRYGHSKSCGCLSRELTAIRTRKHFGLGTPEYKTWVNIRARCDDQNHASYKYYGGRGVKVCERWQDFRNFLADMGQRPSADHSIDRFPNSAGNYEPGNCRWATEIEQQNNKSSNVRVSLDGITMTLAEWGRKMGYQGGLIGARIARGWAVKDAILTSPGIYKNRGRA